MRDKKKIKPKHYFELDNRQLLFVFAGLLVICVFVFTAGVMLGSRSSEEKELAEREEKKLAAKIKAPALLEEKKEKAPAPEPVRIPAAEKPQPASPVPAPAEKESTAAPKTIEELLEREEKVSVSAKKTVKPDVEPAAASTQKPAAAEAKRSEPAKKDLYFVQVASFQKQEDADGQSKKLAAKGYKVIVMKADLPGKGLWYRLRLGPYKDSSEAKTAALSFEKAEKTSVFVTRD